MLRDKKENIPPSGVLALLGIVGVGCLILMACFPAEGIGFGESFRIKFKTLASIGDTTQSEHGSIAGNIDDYLTRYDSVPQAANPHDSLKVIRPLNPASIQFRDGDASPLYTFFNELEKLSGEQDAVHILHYGDSQIEIDRITGVIRSRFQDKFGGRGPGLITPVPIAASAAITQDQSGNWKRYTAYGFQDQKSAHSSFGVMASYGRYLPAKDASAIHSTDSVTAWLEFSPSYMAAGSARLYSKAVLYAGNNLADVRVEIMADDSSLGSKILPAGSTVKAYSWNLSSTPEKLRLIFHGADSPDVHGISFEDGSGVYMHNIALRGSSGNIFTKINASSFEAASSRMSPSLVILQFGGNTVPYIESSKAAADYGSFFRSQIQYLKKIYPGAAFIVIGPSDMSTRINGVYQTWPFLEEVRNALRDNALAEGCGFWDMYEVMGGKNSMISWVQNNPPYAAPDYTHFTPKGARKIAEIFFNSLYSEYEAWYSAKLSSALSPF
ncbi:MAG: hypothetical protein RL220_1834 [Bacteroidota bacterium]